MSHRLRLVCGHLGALPPSLKSLAREDAANSSLSALPTVFKGRPGIRLANEVVELIALTGGGHIASFRRLDAEVANPLWEPPWPTVDPSLRRLTASGGEELEEKGFKFAEPLEVLVLVCPYDVFDVGCKCAMCDGGHNVCADVFGSHSPGEVGQGLSFHGEAALVTWEVMRVQRDTDSLTITLKAVLPVSQLEFTRTFCLKKLSSTISVQEKMRNLVGFERALGVAQHVTIGETWLRDGCTFACNGDKGRTWPEDVKESTIVPATEYSYPLIPGKQGDVDWRSYPRGKEGSWNVESNLAALRIDPKAELGWFACETKGQGAKGEKWALVYAWERAAFPWLVSWEECYARSAAPWNNRTLARGLEFSSYCLPTSRQWNVSQGSSLHTPTFQWLDGASEKTTTFHMSIQKLEHSLPCRSSSQQIHVALSSTECVHKDILLSH